MNNKQLTFLIVGVFILLVALAGFFHATNVAQYVAAGAVMFFGAVMAAGGSQS
jgi:hypothetical protein